MEYQVLFSLKKKNNNSKIILECSDTNLLSTLTITAFWDNSPDDNFMIIFFSQKIGFGILCKLSPKETDFMKY